MPGSALTALAAAHAAYESKFGHAFVISLSRYRPAEHLDEILAGVHTRLAHERDGERDIAAEELRGLARSRLAQLMADPPDGVSLAPETTGTPGPPYH